MNNYVYVSVTTDSNNIKDGSVWYMVLKSKEKILYVEIPHNNTKCSEEMFKVLFNGSYFKGLSEADVDLKIFKKEDTEDYFPINAFTSQDKNKQFQKIQNFLYEIYCKNNKKIVFVFENTYDEVFFFSEAFEFKEGYALLPDFIETGTIIIETFFTLTGDWNNYLIDKTNFINEFINNAKNDKENQAYIMIERMKDL